MHWVRVCVAVLWLNKKPNLSKLLNAPFGFWDRHKCYSLPSGVKCKLTLSTAHHYFDILLLLKISYSFFKFSSSVIHFTVEYLSKITRYLPDRGPLMVAQWLRYYATNRKVAGSIPDGVIGIFYWYNPSDRTMALGSTQPLREMSTRSISRG
jgi:hypothetical protein